MSIELDAAAYTVRPQGAQDADEIETLLDAAFGPGRFAKSSYRLREGVDPIDALSFVAADNADGHLMGSIRFWPILIGPNAEGVETEALLLGPLAVLPNLQRKGVGLALMKAGLDRAAALGHQLVVLVGDLPYYARVGFSIVPQGSVDMPQPFDPSRLLWRELVDGASEGVGGPIHRPASG